MATNKATAAGKAARSKALSHRSVAQAAKTRVVIDKKLGTSTPKHISTLAKRAL